MSAPGRLCSESGYLRSASAACFTASACSSMCRKPFTASTVAASSTFAGVMWFEAPAWSSAPHFEGHHFCALSFGGDIVSACAGEIEASPNFPCVAPAT